VGFGGDAVPGVLGDRCVREAGGAVVAVGLHLRSDDATSVLLRWKRDQNYVALATVAGFHPAVVWSPTPTPGDTCDAAVLLAEEQTLTVNVERVDGACGKALTAAEYMVRRIQGS
jgi:hypothetical protein